MLRASKFFPKYAVSIASRRELQLCFELNHFATKHFPTYVLFSLTWLVWESALKTMVSVSFIRYLFQTFAIV